MSNPLDEIVARAALPGPVDGESIASFAHRVAVVGAHLGFAHAHATTAVAVVVQHHETEATQ